MVAKMYTDFFNQASYDSLIRESGHPHWGASLDWLSASANLKKLNDHIKTETYSEFALQHYKLQAHKGISQIKDPLWKRVCEDLLKMLGPVAFKDFWKISLIDISREGRKAHFACPSEILAESIQKYHFVIIEALKKYYPSLFAIETRV